MDAARPEEVEVPYDPLDVVEHVLVAENLPFDRTDEGDVAFALAGDWKDYELWFAWRPEGDCLQLCCALDLQASRSGPRTARSSSATLWPCPWGSVRRWRRRPQ
jgi:hypothetical protein